MDIEKLKRKLETNIVNIEFRSLRSGDIKSREYTLSEKYMKIPNHIRKQSGDKLLCYDLEFQKWEDLQTHTILGYKVVG